MSEIVKAEYNPETGVSYVEKVTRYGTFSGRAKVSDCDKDVANRWDGCRFAEFKADLKMRKNKVKQYHQRYIGAKMAFDNIAQGHDPESEVMLLLRRQYTLMYRDYVHELQKYTEMKHSYRDYVKNTLNVRRELRAKTGE